MDYDAMTRRVLARAGEYEKRKKNRRKTALRVGVPALCVLAVGIGVVHASLRASRAWKEWTELVRGSDVSLIIGLAAYKLGREDKWAGSSAELEWINDPDIINKQIAAAAASEADGYALYY